MTKELQTIQRQVLEKSINLPSNSAFSGIQSALGTVSKLGTFAAEQISVKQAGIEGASAAESSKGPRTLAPGLTNATKAYNNSYNEVQTSIALNGAAELMDRDLLSSMSPGNLNPNSLKSYDQMALARIEGTLEGINPENRADVALRANSHRMSNLNRLATAVTGQANKNISDGLNLAYSDSLDNVRSSIVSGTKEDQKLSFQSAQKSIKDYQNLQGISPTETIRLERQLQQAVINATLEKGYTDSVVASGEDGGVKFITGFVKSEQGDMSFVQKEQAKDFLLSLNTKFNQELNVASTQAFSNIMSKVLTDPSSIPTLQDLDKEILAQEESGLPMNLAQQNTLKTKIQSGNSAAAKRTATNSAIVKSIQNRSTDIVDFSGTDLNNFFEDTTNAQKQARNGAVASGKIAEGALPDWQIEANVASLSLVPIPAFTKRLSARLTNMNLMGLDEAIRQYSFLTDANKEALSGLTDKETAFADTMLLDIKNSPPNRDMAKIFDENKEAILDASTEIVAMRAANHKEQQRARPTQNDNNIRQAFNIRHGFFGGGDIPDDMRITYDRLLSKNAILYEAKDYDLAVDKTIGQLKDIYKESPKYAPIGRPVPNPVENLPFAGIGFGVENQSANVINEIITSQEKFADDLPVKFSRSDKMPDFPETMSDEQRFNDNLAPNGRWIKYDGEITKGIETEVYWISPNFSKTDPFAPNVYQLFYGYKGEDGKEKEVMRPMKTIQSQLGAPEQLGLTMTTMFPPNIYMPTMMAKLDNESSQAGLESAAVEKIYKQNPVKLSDYHFPTQAGSGQKGIADLRSDLEKRNLAVKESKELLKEEIKLSVLQEQERRLGQSLEEEEDGE